MKTKVLITLIAFMMSLSASAKGIDSVFKEFKSAENVEVINVPRFMLWLGTRFVGKDEAPIVKKITGVQVLIMSSPGEAQRSAFNSAINSVDSDLLLHTTDDGDEVKIWGNVKGPQIKDVYIYIADAEEVLLTKFSGKFSKEDLTALVKEAK